MGVKWCFPASKLKFVGLRNVMGPSAVFLSRIFHPTMAASTNGTSPPFSGSVFHKFPRCATIRRWLLCIVVPPPVAVPCICREINARKSCVKSSCHSFNIETIHFIRRCNSPLKNAVGMRPSSQDLSNLRKFSSVNKSRGWADITALPSLSLLCINEAGKTRPPIIYGNNIMCRQERVMQWCVWGNLNWTFTGTKQHPLHTLTCSLPILRWWPWYICKSLWTCGIKWYYWCIRFISMFFK